MLIDYIGYRLYRLLLYVINRNLRKQILLMYHLFSQKYCNKNQLCQYFSDSLCVYIYFIFQLCTERKITRKDQNKQKKEVISISRSSRALVRIRKPLKTDSYFRWHRSEPIESVRYYTYPSSKKKKWLEDSIRLIGNQRMGMEIEII